jgi:sterol desaturase/sphingolipid hydroxylase (fatty acid hydroxylase superfamily)
MEALFDIIKKSYIGYYNYLKKEILFPGWDNYFYALIAISLIVWVLELIFPWRKNQPIFRKDFWLDTFYMFFNFFILNLILLIALSDTTAHAFNQLLQSVHLNLSSFQIVAVNDLPKPIGLLLFFLITDFVQWNTHRLLHRVNFFWSFHKVHHSVKEMGFAAHLRYHWMEPVVYKSLLYIPIAIIGGFAAQDVILVHFLAITIGHLNHANIGWDYGVFKYIFNNPKMHIWHHSKNIPQQHGANFGISLSIWDYIFKTNYVPHDGRDNELGFENDETFPQNFLQQEIYPLKIKK